MTERHTELLGILRIGRETSLRGAGISLREALTRTHYKELRASFGAVDLLPLVKAHPTLADEWIAYAGDKRTSGGWHLSEEGEIRRLLAPQSRMRFDSLEEAVAEYVVRELDFWAGLAEAH